MRPFWLINDLREPLPLKRLNLIQKKPEPVQIIRLQLLKHKSCLTCDYSGEGPGGEFVSPTNTNAASLNYVT